MFRTLTTAALAALAALTIGGAAQASQINIAITVKDRGAPHVRYGGYEPHERYVRSPWDDDRHPGKFYGRPVPEYGYGGHPAWTRAAYRRPDWHHDDCRTIIKKTVSPWGKTVKHIKICD